MSAFSDDKTIEKFKNKIKDFFKEFRTYNFDSLDVNFVQDKLSAHNMCADFFINEFLENYTKM